MPHESPRGGEPPSPGEQFVVDAELVERAIGLLRPVARSGSTVTYEELSRRLEPDALDGRDGRPDLAGLLRRVSMTEEQAGRGLLSAVVVRRSGRPGPGWYRLAAEVGRDVSDPERAWTAEVRRLREYNQD